MRRRLTPRVLVDFGQLGNEASQGGLPEPDLKWSVFFPKEPEPGLFRTEKALASDAAPTPAPWYGKAPKCTYFRVRGGGATRRRRVRFPDRRSAERTRRRKTRRRRVRSPDRGQGSDRGVEQKRKRTEREEEGGIWRNSAGLWLARKDLSTRQRCPDKPVVSQSRF